MPGSPPKKIQKLTFDTNVFENNSCGKCEVVIKQFEKKIDDLKSSMEQQTNILRGQLQIAIEALADQKATLNLLLRDRATELPISGQFPLKEEEQLCKLNANINENNKELYAKSMKSLLQPAGVIKNLKNILGDDIIIQYNVDGVQGKKSLKSLGNFYGALLNGISLGNGEGTAEHQLRKAIQLQKKKNF